MALKELKPPTYGANVMFNVSPLAEEITGAVRPTLVTLLTAVIAVLLIACVNVTNLLLARGVHRRAEFALRAALGAGRGRLLCQVLVESLLLAAMGGIVGLAVASFGLDALVALSPPGLPRAGAIRVDATVLLISLAITVLVGVTVGLVPALQVAHSDPQQDPPVRLADSRPGAPPPPQRARRRRSCPCARSARRVRAAVPEPPAGGCGAHRLRPVAHAHDAASAGRPAGSRPERNTSVPRGRSRPRSDRCPGS